MCGIYGWQWRHDNKPSLVRRMILAATLGAANDNRGGDSWGWFSLNTRQFNKSLGRIMFDARFAAHHDSIICHTRKATVGKISVENSHPWRFGHIVGAHNGSVNNHLEIKNKTGVDLEVDSMYIFDSFQRGKGFEGIRGYGAVEWINESENPNAIKLLRASGGASLSVLVNAHGVVWSSDKDHLKLALAVSGIGDGDKVLEPESQIVYRVEGGKLFKTTTKMGFEEYQYSSNTTSYGSGWQGHGSYYQRSMQYGPDPRPTPPDLEKWRPTKSIRKTIGKAVAKLPPGVAAYICGDCYREVDEQKRCPRGHSGAVLVVKDVATGPVE